MIDDWSLDGKEKIEVLVPINTVMEELRKEGCEGKHHDGKQHLCCHAYSLPILPMYSKEDIETLRKKLKADLDALYERVEKRHCMIGATNSELRIMDRGAMEVIDSIQKEINKRFGVDE